MNARVRQVPADHTPIVSAPGPALYDKISREDILAHAHAQCCSNKGAPGADRQDFEALRRTGWSDGLANWRLRSRRRLTIGPYQTRAHAEGQRQTQAAGHLNLARSGLHDSSDAGAEAGLPSELYAYRPGRNAQQAVVEVEELLFRGHPEVVDANLAGYFGAFRIPNF
jgi:RNA-directed DNA polymerase